MRKIPKNPDPNLTLQNRYSLLKNKSSTQKEGNAKTQKKNEQFSTIHQPELQDSFKENDRK